MSNSIGSLRFLGAMDWREFVETHERGRADAARGSGRRLRARWTSPPATATATWSRRSRSAAALRGRGGAQGDRAGARRRARTARRRAPRTSAIYLIDDGPRRSSSARRGVRAVGADALRRAARRASPLPLYLGAIVLVTLASAPRPLLAQAHATAAGRAGLLVAARRRAASPTSQLAVALVNWLATLLVAPQPLPRMDFSDGIPPESRTLVVVPTMLDERATTSRRWSRRWRCASSPTATTHLHFAPADRFPRRARARRCPADAALRRAPRATASTR